MCEGCKNQLQQMINGHEDRPMRAYKYQCGFSCIYCQWGIHKSCLELVALAILHEDLRIYWDTPELHEAKK